MIQVLLFVFKFIGITVLTVLGIILLLLAVVLFVPIFYKVRIIHNPEKTQVKARVSFLFPLFLVTVEYFKKLSYKARIFGFALLDSEKPKKDKPEKVKKPKKKKQKKKKEERTENIKQEETKPEKKYVSEPSREQDTENEKEKKPEKVGFFEKIRSKIQKIRETICTIIYKIKKIFRQKEEVQRIFAKPETRTALRFAWDKLKHLLKHVFPRKVKGYVAFGADDPATTGQVLGILSILYTKTGELLTLRPNFTEKQLECDVELKGRIQVFTLLVIAVKVFFNQELRQLITEMKRVREIE